MRFAIHEHTCICITHLYVFLCIYFLEKSVWVRVMMHFPQEKSGYSSNYIYCLIESHLNKGRCDSTSQPSKLMLNTSDFGGNFPV
jgi:hypothetical protein